MGAIAYQITSLAIVYSTVYSDADERKHQSSASLDFVRGIHRGPAQMASSAENVSIWWRHHVVHAMAAQTNQLHVYLTQFDRNEICESKLGHRSGDYKFCLIRYAQGPDSV